MGARRRRLPPAATVLAMALLAMALLAPVNGSAQEQITRIGVVDLDAVVRAYFRESESFRAYEARREEIDGEREAIEGEIHNLEQARLEARQAGDRRLELLLDQQIFDQREHLLQFVRVMNDQLRREYEGLKTSDRFTAELAEALAFVAETLGFSLIRSTQNLFYWDTDIDLTDEVIADLARRAARR